MAVSHFGPLFQTHILYKTRVRYHTLERVYTRYARIGVYKNSGT